MSASKLCGRITDHPAHFWNGHPGRPELGDLDSEGFLRKVEYRCPGHVVIEGGQRSAQTNGGAR